MVFTYMGSSEDHRGMLFIIVDGTWKMDSDGAWLATYESVSDPDVILADCPETSMVPAFRYDEVVGLIAALDR